MATVLITGGTGMIGKAICKALLDKGFSVIILTRNPQKVTGASIPETTGYGSMSYAKWDVEKQAIDSGAISNADYIIHLAGASVAQKRWTKKRKQEIISSRVNSSKLILDSLEKIPNNVKAIISASAIGWYGPDLPHLSSKRGGFTETDPHATDFLGQTCKQWEESIEPVKSPGKRLVKLRIGIVLSNEGGALDEFKKPLRFGIAPIIGNGTQITSWIHIDDLVRMFIYAMEKEMVSGVYNAVAPTPVSNKDLVLTLAKKMKGNFFIPVYVPSFIIKIMLGEMGSEVLKSTNVSCEKIKAMGFNFQYATIENAMHQLMHS